MCRNWWLLGKMYYSFTFIHNRINGTVSVYSTLLYSTLLYSTILHVCYCLKTTIDSWHKILSKPKHSLDSLPAPPQRGILRCLLTMPVWQPWMENPMFSRWPCSASTLFAERVAAWTPKRWNVRPPRPTRPFRAWSRSVIPMHVGLYFASGGWRAGDLRGAAGSVTTCHSFDFSLCSNIVKELSSRRKGMEALLQRLPWQTLDCCMAGSCENLAASVQADSDRTKMSRNSVNSHCSKSLTLLLPKHLKHLKFNWFAPKTSQKFEVQLVCSKNISKIWSSIGLLQKHFKNLKFNIFAPKSSQQFEVPFWFLILLSYPFGCLFVPIPLENNGNHACRDDLSRDSALLARVSALLARDWHEDVQRNEKIGMLTNWFT